MVTQKLKIFIFIGIVALLLAFGNCILFQPPRYRLVVYAEPNLKKADIYIDSKLVKSSVNIDASFHLSYERHEIKVIQEGFKPFVAILEPPEPGESMYGFEVKFEPIDSTGTNQVLSPDTIKII